MLVKQGTPLYGFEIERREGDNVLYINYLGASFVPSIADSAEVMSKTIDALLDNSNVSRVVFVQQRNYHYPFEQVKLLVEIAQLYNYLMQQERVLSAERLGLFSNVQGAHEQVVYLIGLLKQDPIGCYLEIKRLIESFKNSDNKGNYFGSFLERFKGLMEQTKIISKIKEEDLIVGDREVYANIFRADVMPNFTFTRLVAQLPENANLIDQYNILSGEEEITVTILKREGDTGYLYHILPPEYSLSEEHHMLLNLGRGVLMEHQPKAEEFVDADRTRSVFFSVARDLLLELSRTRGISLSFKELSKLARILVRQTIGFGLIEVLLFDNKLQDIYLNAPIAQQPV